MIAGMDPDTQALRDISFGEYLQRMGEKFRPAAESIQMKEEYLNRTQRAEEDVQSYVSEKTELFRAAFPHANLREWSRCWVDTAEGLCNWYVRDQMMASESRDTEDFAQQAVREVQAERTCIRIGDSTEGRDGLEPVSRRIGAGKREKAQRGSPRESPLGEEGGRPQRERLGRGNGKPTSGRSPRVAESEERLQRSIEPDRGQRIRKRRGNRGAGEGRGGPTAACTQP